jgi:hypothetical protein
MGSAAFVVFCLCVALISRSNLSDAVPLILTILLAAVVALWGGSKD